MTMPNFLIIGAPKAGTTSLYEYLKQHPQIYMSNPKEPRFFAHEGDSLDYQGPKDAEYMKRTVVTDLNSYKALFEGALNKKAIGEASPIYLYSKKAPERIKHYVPKAKLIAILRNPVDRAYSSYNSMVQMGREKLRFLEALDQEDLRISQRWNQFWHYKRLGLYAAQIRHYFSFFNQEQMRIYLFDKLRSNPQAVLKDIYRFLEVDDTFEVDTSRKFNRSIPFKNKPLYSFLRNSYIYRVVSKKFIPAGTKDRILDYLQQKNHLTPRLSQKTRVRLSKEFQKDILELQVLVNKDLSHWLDV